MEWSILIMRVMGVMGVMGVLINMERVGVVSGVKDGAAGADGRPATLQLYEYSYAHIN